MERIDASPVKRVFITDTIVSKGPLSSKVEVISVGNIFADAIGRINKGESLSALFEAE
jgi:phosphoribosylpyrophosphate synthetase